MHWIGLLIVGGAVQLSGALIAELKSKDTLSRQMSSSQGDSSDCVASASSVTTAETQYERGPRIKHVCRRAAVVFGERATFPSVQSASQSSPSEINLSALPSHEKKHVVQLSAEGLLTWSSVAILFLYGCLGV